MFYFQFLKFSCDFLIYAHLLQVLSRSEMSVLSSKTKTQFPPKYPLNLNKPPTFLLLFSHLCTKSYQISTNRNYTGHPV